MPRFLKTSLYFLEAHKGNYYMYDVLPYCPIAMTEQWRLFRGWKKIVRTFSCCRPIFQSVSLLYPIICILTWAVLNRLV